MNYDTYWLWLYMVFGAANSSLWKLLNGFDNAKSLAEAVFNGNVSELDKSKAALAREMPFEKADEIIKVCDDDGIRIYCYESEGFPEQLRRIANPPTILFCRGNLDFLNNRIVAAVSGSHSPSEYSSTITDKLCKELAEKDCVIASGLTEGIDALAAQAAVSGEKPVLGVLGTEIDSVENSESELIKQIAENGAVISETCSLIKGWRPAFTFRNRIMVGLSDGVIFFEAREGCHGLNNVQHAVYQGKQIFAVPPHDLTDERYFGQIDLLRKGCKPIFSADDFLYYVSQKRPEDVYFDGIGDIYTDISSMSVFNDDSAEGADIAQGTSRKIRGKAKSADTVKNIRPAEFDFSGLEGLKLDICKQIETEPMLVDMISSALEADIDEVFSTLIELELEGKVVSLAGHRYGLKVQNGE